MFQKEHPSGSFDSNETLVIISAAAADGWLTTDWSQDEKGNLAHEVARAVYGEMTELYLHGVRHFLLMSHWPIEVPNSDQGWDTEGNWYAQTQNEETFRLAPEFRSNHTDAVLLIMQPFEVVKEAYHHALSKNISLLPCLRSAYGPLCDDPDNHLWTDGAHYSDWVHRMLADHARSLIRSEFEIREIVITLIENNDVIIGLTIGALIICYLL
eukprot:TRINITY_DN17400_c0_g1_i2.p1 TRINITY_DN17400_c0_g1~~TRINITY_DN17400_c0_g1_i2.p1  ORF type:complete len:212 (-),score=7.17 TRINITY_DN17400_c0_g1_i2:53-688(-)